MDKLLCIVLTLSVAGLGVGFLGLAERANDACHQRQRGYDGLVKYTAFLGEEFHATPAQLAHGEKDFVHIMGPRPTC